MTSTLQLYFVPMSTVGLASDARLAPQADGAATQLVALLFIASAAPGGGTGQTDFERLARALLTWALNGFASGPEPATVTFNALDALIGKPTSPRQRTFGELQAFLAGQLTFQLNGPKSLPPGAALALFPMFPSLQLTTSDEKYSVDFGTYRAADPAYQQFVADYFARLAVDVGGQPSDSGSSARAPRSESMATGVFADYLGLIWRQVVGDAKTWLRKQSLPSTTLAALASAGVFNGAAGFASRFLLHGLRLPDPDQGVPAPGAWKGHPLYPLFALTGQQWAAPAIQPAPFSYSISLKPGAMAAPPAVLPTNVDAAHPILVDLKDLEIDPNHRDGLKLLGDYQQVLAGSATDPLGIESVLGSVAPIDPWVQTGKRYPLAGRAAWQSKLLPSFSDPLRAQIAAAVAGGAASVDLRLGTVSPSDRPDKAPAWLDGSAFTWVTRLDFSVQPAVDPGGSGQPVASAYEIRGTNQDDRHDLFALLAYLQDNNVSADAFTVDLAYAGDDGALVSDLAPTALLVRANLSTGTAGHDARPLAAAELDSVDHTVDQQANYRTDFLTLLWESSLAATGGYYLYYRKSDGTGLPDRLFTEGHSGTLTVLVTLTGGGPVLPFHNAAATTAAVAADAVFLVEPGPGSQTYPGWLTRRASLPPGNAGFKLVRRPPANPLTVAKDQLATMFNLLGVWLEDAGGFNESPEGLPVGPIQGDDSVAPDPGADWRYRRILGIAPFAKSPGGGAAFPGPNPYAGVGDLVRLGFLWHDIFGNRLVSDAHAKSLDIPIRYRDPLFPLGQWPGISVSYAFGAGRVLTLALGIVPSRYTPAGAQATTDRARADAARFRQIYFQLAQADVSAGATCTVDDAVEHALPKGDLLTFVTQAKAYVDAVLAGSTPAATPLLTLAVTLGEGTPTAVIAPLIVQVIVRRDGDLVDADFKVEPGVTSVASDVRPLLTVTDGDPLGLLAFAQDFEARFPLKLASGTRDDSGQLYVVELQSSKLGFAIPSASSPHFFAPKPLSVVPWSATDVPIIPYVSGQAFDPTTAVKKSFRGIDLDTWGRDLLRDVDRMLSARYAIAFHLRDPASYRTLLDAKEKLADAIEETVAEILDDVGGDLAAAKEALRQKLLVSLSEAYLVDAIVQLPITVTCPADAALPAPPTTPTTAAAPVMRFSFQPRGIIPVPPGATLASLGAQLGVPLELIVELLADNANLLVPKVAIAYQGKSHAVAPGESLRQVAAALGADVQALAQALASTTGLLQPGASLDIIKRACTVSAGDTLRTVLDLLAPEIMASGDPQGAIVDFVDINHALPGIFVDGATFHVSGHAYVVSGSMSLDGLAAQAGLTSPALVAALLDIPSLLAPGVTLGFLSALPGHTLSQARVDVPGGGPAVRQEPLTFLLEIASHARLSNLSLSLSFQLDQLEYAISAPAPWAGGYEESDWLSFVLPPGGSAGRIDIPIPLRAYPATPTVDHHAIVQAPLDSPTLAQIRAYTYQFVYTYVRAAQDEMSLSVAYNTLSIDDADEADAAAGATPDLAQLLAQYAAIAAALNADLALLATVPPSDVSSDSAKRAHNAVTVFAAQVDAVADAWKVWSPPLPPLPASGADVTHVVAHSLDAAGKAQVVVSSRTPGAEPPTVTPVGHEPSFLHRGEAHTLTAFQPVVGGDDVLRADQFEYDTPSLDVITQQSAWGSVGITRNHTLLAGKTTHPEFIYRIADVRFYSAAVPLVTYRAPFDLASVKTRLTPAPPSKLWSLLASFFAELLGVDPKGPATVRPGVRTAVSFGTRLAGAPAARAAASTNIISLLPVLLSPLATFDPQVDLLQPTGLCARLADAMTAFLVENKPATAGARWVLDVSVYTSLAEDGKTAQRPPLLELTDVQLALSDVG